MNHHDLRELNMNDPLERSLEAMMNEPVPNGPEARVASDTLASIQRAARQDHAPSGMVRFFQPIQKAFAMSFTQKIAAAAGLTVAALVFWFMFTLSSSVGYAQVAARLSAIHSMTCVGTVTGAGLDKPQVIKMMFLGAGRMREEINPSTVILCNMQSGQTMILDAAAKSATIVKIDMNDADVRKTNESTDFFAQFRKLPGENSEPLGDKQIDGAVLKGFRVKHDSQVLSIWADAKTGVTRRVESTMQLNGKDMQMVLDQFNFDPELDASLFSDTPPSDYHVTSQSMALNMNVEENVADMLRRYSSLMDGAFPESLNMPEMIEKYVEALLKADRRKPMDMTFASAAGGITAYTSLHRVGVDYDYIPGVHLGEATKIVFWRHDQETGKYKAVYGDLRIADVTADVISSSTTQPVRETTQPAMN